MKLFISECKTEIDVIVLCETWFNPNLCDLYKIDGYNSYHSCREMRNGGGVSIYVLNTIIVRNVEKKNNDITYVKLDITNVDTLNEMIIIGLYRVPKYDNLNRFFELMDFLLHNSANKNCILTGDINIDIHSSKTNTTKTKYLNILNSHNFSVYNTSPTRDISGSVVDHMITNMTSNYKLNIDTIGVTFSDHNMLLTQIECSQSNKSRIRTYKKINFRVLNENLQKVFYDHPIETNCVNDLYNHISQNIQSEVHKATRTKMVKMNKVKECEWM